MKSLWLAGLVGIAACTTPRSDELTSEPADAAAAAGGAAGSLGTPERGPVDARAGAGGQSGAAGPPSPPGRFDAATGAAPDASSPGAPTDGAGLPHPSDPCAGLTGCSTIDQSSTAARTPGVSEGAVSLGEGALGQVVTIGRTGHLTGVRLEVSCRDNGGLKLEIFAASSGRTFGDALATRQLTTAELTAQKAELPLFSFSPALLVTGGRQIAIIATVDALCEFQLTYNHYPGGAMVDLGPFSLYGADADLLFETYVAP